MIKPHGSDELNPLFVYDAQKHHELTHEAESLPTLMLNSRDDRRCPLPMGKAFHQALLSSGVPTGLIIYPNEPHGIRQPRHRADKLQRILDWFEKHSGR